MFIHSYIEMLRKCCLPCAAVPCKAGIEDAIYIFNKTFGLIFLVHHGSNLRDIVACWFGVLDSDPYPQQLGCYTFNFLLSPHPQSLFNPFFLSMPSGF